MAEANIRAVITARDDASRTLDGFGMSFGKLVSGVALGNAAFAGAQMALHGLEEAIGSVTNFVKDSVGSAESLGLATLKLERNFGLTAEQGSGLIAVLGRFGLTADDASRAFGIFEKHLLNVKDSESIGVKSFQLLGIATTDGTGKLRSMNDVLMDVADKFKSGAIPATERAGVAMDLFGRSGQNLIPILLQGRDGIAQLEAKAKSMGIVLDQNGVEAARKFAAAQMDMNQAIEGVKVKIGSALMPVITDLIENHLMKWIDKNGGVAKIMDEKVIPKINELKDTIMKFAKDASTWWEKHHKDVEEAAAIIIKVVGAILDAIGGLVSIYDRLTGKSKSSGDSIIKDWAILASVGQATFGTIAASIEIGWRVIDFFKDHVAAIVGPVIGFIETIASAFGRLPGAVQASISAASSALGGILGPLSTVASAVETLIGLFDQLMNKKTNLHPTSSVQNVNGTNVSVPGFAFGGYTGVGGANDIAGVVHKGEYVLPKDAVDQSTGMPKVQVGSSAPISITVQAGAFMGNPQDARQYAKLILDALQDVASAKGMSFDQLWRHNGVRSI